ncbi:MAG: PQQ-dependent sugar dehydrogenase [Pseudomonadota bacterium]
MPPDNPFAGNPQCGPSANANDCPEIFAWGLRNPWRWAFDDATDALWLADVGQAAREEVNLIERGGNYGWRCREGDIATSNAADCNAAGTLVEPVTVYGRSDGNSITGGQVYRGTAISELVGRYVFADFGSGRIWAAQPNLQGSFDNDLLINSAISPTAFAIGPDDELYLVNIDGGNGRGRIWRMIAASSGNPDTIAELLSQSGCVSGTDITAPYSGLIPYTLNAPFWSDGALKDRYIGLPNSTTMTIGTDGDIEFPPGTVIVKNFRLGGALIETRHLMRHPDGVWAGYTYEWNAAQTEATRVRGGKTVTINGQDWIYPSGAQCLQCHTQAAGVSLGPEVAQWNRNFAYPATGRNANQLDTLAHVMSFSAPLPAPVAQLDRLASPSDTGASLSDRARAYLHSNCAGCHRVNGPTPSDLDLRYSTPLMATNGCDVRPTGSDLGLTNARLIAPGDASRSTLWERLRRRDTHAMPPVGSTVVDANGVDLIGQWIDSLTTCN